jgi:hypothetical protein
MPAIPPDAELPPPSTPEAAALARLIGRAATLALIEAHGGARIAIPKSVNQASVLARDIGLDAARILAEGHGGAMLKVPLAKFWRAMIYRRRDGLSYAAIARRLGASESSVHAWLREGGATGAPKQLDLFPDA